jgi:hypothetical protein
MGAPCQSLQYNYLNAPLDKSAYKNGPKFCQVGPNFIRNIKAGYSGKIGVEALPSGVNIPHF